MRRLWIAIGFISIAVALPPQLERSSSLTQLVQRRAESQPRLAPAPFVPRHEHHEESHHVEPVPNVEEPVGANEADLIDSPSISDSASAPAWPFDHKSVAHEDQTPEVNEHDHHHSRLPPKIELDEAEILRTHAPDPPSYFDMDQTDEGMPRTMIGHIVTMCLAFFVFLPLTIFLKAGRSHLSILPQVSFVGLSVIGVLLGRVYSWNTPDLYEGAVHTSWGYLTVILAIALNFLDVARFVLRYSSLGVRFERVIASLKLATLSGDRGQDAEGGLAEERVALVISPGLYPQTRWSEDSPSPSTSRSNSSTFSDGDTVYDSAGPSDHSPAPIDTKDQSRLRSLVAAALDLSMRLLIILAYIVMFTGVAAYSGLCRGNYRNGCLAHGIKGSVFFWYGLLTFARYCGGMSALGWSWNKLPSGEKSIFSAEFVESFVIFFYGSTNTWMERIGKTGAYSVKDVQHISIAVMFWAAGALGMLLESRTVRAWLATPAMQASSQDPARIPPPASASFSFNPFPALVIGVTGIAMSAHHQAYQFQVEIHALWGYLLAAFSLFRFLTYFFLYLRPPASILPSRPPTEALASLFLTCGGVVFVLSTEQITFAAMRHHADDMMAFLNVTFALVCVIFFWIAVLFGLKGWALKRNPPTPPQESPAKTACIYNTTSILAPGRTRARPIHNANSCK
ncbi:Tvs1p [Sporobolomyces koalae]|uniref:Tvs1p n=1 Tax=Sporobolomyces koalae TaxID=500713 RepID=UPI00316D5BF6